MRLARLSLWSWLKWACLGLFLGSLLLAVILLGVSQSQLKAGKVKVQKGLLSMVDKPLIVERAGEKLVWRLQADKAEQESAGRMHLLRPRLELFTEAGIPVPIHAREAWFEPLAKRIRFHGEVEMRYRDWVVTGETLAYDNGRDEVRMPQDFRVSGQGIRARGRNLRILRGERHLWVDNGVWIEDARPGAWGGLP